LGRRRTSILSLGVGPKRLGGAYGAFNRDPNFSGLPSLYNHNIAGITANSVLADKGKRLSVIEDAYVLTIPPPPVHGIGNAGGFKMMLEERGGLGTEALVKAANKLVAAANRDLSFAGVFTPINALSPSVYADIDRLKGEKVGLTPSDVFDTLQVYLGSQYVNDFNFLGRTYEVIAQADGRFRRDKQDLMGLKARKRCRRDGADRVGHAIADTTIPYRMPRYNLIRRPKRGVSRRLELPLARVANHGSTGRNGASTRYQLRVDRDCLSARAEGHADDAGVRRFGVVRAPGTGSELRELEPASLDCLIVPMCLLASTTGLMFRGMPVDILAQIGSWCWFGDEECDPNRRVRAPGAGYRKQGCRGSGQCRPASVAPILMTSLAFILGVAPLVAATGAVAEMRQSLGTAVFGGMFGVTCFGLLFTPAFYTLVQHVGNVRGRAPPLCGGGKSGATRNSAQAQRRPGRQRRIEGEECSAIRRFTPKL
jgi:hypothetical protein